MSVTVAPDELDALHERVLRVTDNTGQRWDAYVEHTTVKEPESWTGSGGRIWDEGHLTISLHADDWHTQWPDATIGHAELLASTQEGEWQPLAARVAENPVSEDADDPWGEALGDRRKVVELTVSRGRSSDVMESREIADESLSGIRAQSIRRVTAADIILDYASRVGVEVADSMTLPEFQEALDAVGWEAVGVERYNRLFSVSDRAIRDSLQALEHFRTGDE